MKRQVEAKKPSFLFLPYTQTHMPVYPSKELAGKTKNGDFADVLAQTDAYVERLLDAVETLRIADNTIFIFTADKGLTRRLPHHSFSGPWHGSYFTGFEGSLRVPSIVRCLARCPLASLRTRSSTRWTSTGQWPASPAARFPTDRTIDSIDQLAFLVGKHKKSNRESMVIYVGEEVYGVKWRNWKMMTKVIEISTSSSQHGWGPVRGSSNGS